MGRSRGGDENKRRKLLNQYLNYRDQIRSQQRQNHKQATVEQQHHLDAENAPNPYAMRQPEPYVGKDATEMSASPSAEAAKATEHMPEKAKHEAIQAADVFARYASQHRQQQEQNRGKDKGRERDDER